MWSLASGMPCHGEISFAFVPVTSLSFEVRHVGCWLAARQNDVAALDGWLVGWLVVQVRSQVRLGSCKGRVWCRVGLRSCRWLSFVAHPVRVVVLVSK